MPRRRLTAALLSVLCVGFGLVWPAVAAAAPAVPSLDWQPCEGGFFCATATVPLDYARPRGASIQLAVIKHPATDPAHRIGSLFFNPGGPGGSGVAALPLVYSAFPTALRARFDLVSFDPRGVGQSTDLQCFDSIAEEAQALAGLPAGFPVGAAQQQLWENTFAAFDRACAAHAGALLAHDSTADAARDMDLLRQAVGDLTLHYLGISYGSYLGATYANLFPDRVGAIVLDGDIDPVQWATGTHDNARRLTTFLRQDADEGSGATLTAFLDLCGQATVTSCAFSAGTPAATHAKFSTLLDRLTTHPITIGGQTYTMSRVAALVLAGLYEIHPIPNLAAGWPALAANLQQLWTVSAGDLPADTPRGALDVLPSAAASYTGIEATFGIVCSDSPNPRAPQSYPAQAGFSLLRSGRLGPVWAWLTEVCAQWPVTAAQRYTGSWDRPTAHPILVVGNTVDPATPYQGAVAMSRELAHARLLTVAGYGHTALLNHSSCVDTAESDYFLTGALPSTGAVCPQDQPPFPS